MINRLWKSRIFGFLLSPLALFFAIIVFLKRFCYQAGICKAFRAEVPVISIGNLSVGGTGKTPVVIYLAALMQKQGFKPAVISRGYGRLSKGQVIVSDGNTLINDIKMSGDEPALIAEKLSSIPVIVDGNRKAAIITAVEKLNCDLILLDDAFQHLKVQRDFDLLVVDSTNPCGNGFLLPAGPLRDPLSRLHDGQAVVLTRVDQVDNWPALKDRVSKITAGPVFTSSHQPAQVRGLNSGEILELSSLPGKKVFCFTGIGNPASFWQTVQSAGLEIVNVKAFPDHHWYSAADLGQLEQEAEQSKADFLLCTAKDAVRLRQIDTDPLNIYYLEIDLKINETEKFKQLFDNYFAGVKSVS